MADELTNMQENAITRFEAALVPQDQRKPGEEVLGLPSTTPERRGNRDLSSFRSVRELIIKRQWESPQDREFLLSVQQKFVDQAKPFLDPLKEKIKESIESNDSLQEVLTDMPTAKEAEREMKNKGLYAGENENLEGILYDAVGQVRLEMEIAIEEEKTKDKPDVYDQKLEEKRERLEKERFWNHGLGIGGGGGSEPPNPPGDSAGAEDEPESEAGKEVTAKLQDYKRRIFVARDRGERQRLTRERWTYLNDLEAKNALKVSLSDLARIEIPAMLEQVDSAKPINTLRGALNEFIAECDTSGTLTEELRSLMIFEVNGIIEVGKFAKASKNDPDFGDKLEVTRMANLPIRVDQDDIDAAWTRRAEAHATGGDAPDWEAFFYTFFDRFAAAQAAGNADLLDEMRRQREAVEAQVRLSIKRYDDLLDQVAQRAPIHPLNLIAERPDWYRKLTKEQQDMVVFMSRISYTARNKEEMGPLKLEVSTAPEMMTWPTKDWDNMWTKLPGHRIATVTIMNDLFVRDADHLILKDRTRFNGSANVERVGNLKVITERDGSRWLEGGRDVLKRYTEYQEGLTDDLARYFLENPEAMEIGNWPVYEPDLEKRAHLIALGGIKSFSNMLFVGGGVESADEGRKLATGKDVFSEQLRAFYRPLDKATTKFIKKAEEQATAEGWGGNWGEWFVQGVDFVPNFREQVEEGLVPDYLPRRMFYSLFDLAVMDEGPYRGRSFAEAIMSEAPRQLTDRLKDIDTNRVRPAQLKDNDVWGQTYGDQIDSATKVYLLDTGKADRDYTDKTLADALAKVRGNPRLVPIFDDFDLIMGCEVMLAGGPMLGCYETDSDGVIGRRILVDTGKGEPGSDYDYEIWSATRNSRIFMSMGGGFREEFYRRVMAKNLTKGDVLSALGNVATGANPREQRKLAYRRAMKFTGSH